jgi:hypothetical protein
MHAPRQTDLDGTIDQGDDARLKLEIAKLKKQVRKAGARLRALRSKLADIETALEAQSGVDPLQLELHRSEKARSVVTVAEFSQTTHARRVSAESERGGFDPAKVESPSLHTLGGTQYPEDSEACRLQSALTHSERLQRLTVRFGVEIAERILRREVWLGMARAVALESLGRPGVTRRTARRGGEREREQWIYEDASLLFENGILVSFEDSRGLRRTF